MGGDEEDEGKEKGGERRAMGGYVLKLGDGKEET